MNAAEPVPPEAHVVWKGSDSVNVHYFVQQPWNWVMDELVASSDSEMHKVNAPGDLPSAQSMSSLPNGTTPPSTRRRRGNRKGPPPSTLKLELSDPASGEVIFASHGSSTALDGLEDKDELVRTISRCRCEELELCPPSKLINWDVTHDECLNVVGDQLPALNSNKSVTGFAVLKEPMGSAGQGIYFVENADDVFQVIEEHHQKSKEDPGYLDRLIERKGRIPSWVLQAEVSPCLLIKDRRKFHVRSYVCVIEMLHLPEMLLDTFVYNRHELRIAGRPVNDDDDDRDRLAHITNGALSKTTECVLLREIPELLERGLRRQIELFVAQFFGRHVIADLQRRINQAARYDDPSNFAHRKFAVAGLDLMITENNRIYLLEVNVNPVASSPDSVSNEFREHLKGFLQDLVDLVVGRPSPNFVSCSDIIAR